MLATGLVGQASADSGSDMPNSHPFLLQQLGTSTNWAGWASYAGAGGFAQPGAVSHVSGEWTVPAVTCGAENADSSVWVGIDGLHNEVVQQVGTQQSCRNGKAVYATWWQTYPSPKKVMNVSARPGDRIAAEVVYVGGDRFAMALKNVTTGQSFLVIRHVPGAPRQSAEWIVEAPWKDRVLPLANFGSVTIEKGRATINGRTGSIASAGLLSAPNTQSSTMVDGDSLVKATVTNPALSGNDKFRVTWLHS